MSECVSRRLFFAIWPDQAALQQLVNLRDSLESSIHGRLILPADLHVTLAFLGQVTSDRLQILDAIASDVRAEPFFMSLDQLSEWRNAGVLCLTPRQPPKSLESLVQRLASGLGEAGFVLDKRPFRPHLTLARQVTSVPARLDHRLEPIRFEVRAFHLVQSRPSVSASAYEAIGNWSLG